ncbi:MAG: tryptophan synthase subunit alpha [Rikenellaceae bacterium]|nr:tryptophan synthase subunit alpha [Rikenellaceae bacterium]
MNRIDKLFQTKKREIVSVYFTAGYPKLDDTEAIIRELAGQGVDMVEVGIPFSDPMADGPVIQQSSTAALQNGMTLGCLFAQLDNIRQRVDIPLVMMGYLNPIMQYGIEEFCRDCRRVEIDGVIIPDLPFADYMREYMPLGRKYGLHFIMLITPETSQERIRLIDENTSGFVYMVSTASTTGAKDSFGEQTLDYFRRIDAMNLRNPRLVGFGISNRKTLLAAFENANGAIIGSRFIRLLGSEPTVAMAVNKLMGNLLEG